MDYDEPPDGDDEASIMARELLAHRAAQPRVEALERVVEATEHLLEIYQRPQECTDTYEERLIHLCLSPTAADDRAGSVFAALDALWQTKEEG